jgi:hypothetical protein
MNISASKVLLGLSLAAYAYCSWDHMFPDPPPASAPAEQSKRKGLTAALVNPRVVLDLERDPFESTPLDRGTGAPAALPAEPGKVLGPLDLQAILVSPLGRTALINGRALREGQVVQLGPDQPSIRAQRIGVDYVVVHSGGQVVMLRLDDPSALNAPPGGPGAAAAARGNGRNAPGAAAGGRTMASVSVEQR